MEQYSAGIKQALDKNPRKKKQILAFLNRFTVIDDVLVDKEIFKYTFRCKVPGCGSCCYAGTLVTQNDIDRVAGIVDKLKLYLSESKVRRLNKLENVFYTEFPVEGFYKLRTWGSSCIFQMEDKRCAVHKFCLDNGVDWIKVHFDLCVTYPLRISKKRDMIHIEEELIKREYVYPCFNKKDESNKKDKETDLVYYMKNVIVDRFGKGFWEDLEKLYNRLC